MIACKRSNGVINKARNKVFDYVGRFHEFRKRIRDAARDLKLYAFLRPSVGTEYTPYLVVGEAGESQVFHSFPEISRYLQAFLDDYEAKGCKRCHYTNLAVSWFKITIILVFRMPKSSAY